MSEVRHKTLINIRCVINVSYFTIPYVRIIHNEWSVFLKIGDIQFEFYVNLARKGKHTIT